MLLTFQDAVDHLMNFIQSEGDTLDLNYCREAVPSALREMSLIKDWTIYKTTGRIVTNASYSTGTITYANMGRLVTLSGGTWPSWAMRGVLLIGNTTYRIDSMPTATTLVLNSQQNPGADITTPTSFVIYQNVYPLPEGFKRLIGDVMEVNAKIILAPVSYDSAFFDLHWRVSPSQPWLYAFCGVPGYQNAIGMAFSAPPDISRVYDFPYQRSPRRLLTCAYDTGTISATSTSVSGAGGANWTKRVVGCSLRVSDNSTAPTGLSGSNPFAEERIVVGFTSSNAITISDPFCGNYTNAQYVLSDPVDIDDRVMTNAFYRTAELQLATTRRPTDRAAIFAAWQKDVEEAAAADSRYRRGGHAGSNSTLTWAQRDLLFGQLGRDVGNNG